MYRNPIFERHHPTYTLPWVPLSQDLKTEKAPSHSFDEPIASPHKLVRSKRFSSRSSDCLPTLPDDFNKLSNSNYDDDDDEFDDDDDDEYVDILSKTKHMFVDSTRLDTLLPYITRDFDMHSENNKSIPSAMLAIGLEHTYTENIESAIEYLAKATKHLISTIDVSLHYIFNYIMLTSAFHSLGAFKITIFN